MREILAPDQEASQQRRDSAHQQDPSLLVTVDPSTSRPHPAPPPPPAPQQQTQQQLASAPPQQQPAPAPPPPSPPPQPHSEQPPNPQQPQPGELGSGAGSAGPGAPVEAEAEGFGGSARAVQNPLDAPHLPPHPHLQHQQQQQQQQQQQLQQQQEELAGAGGSSDSPGQPQHVHLLHQPPPQHHLLPHHPQHPPPSLPPQSSQQPSYGSPQQQPQLPLSLQSPLQLPGVPGGPPLGLSLFGTAVPSGPGGADQGLPPHHPHPQPPLPPGCLQQSAPLLGHTSPPHPSVQPHPLLHSQQQQQPQPQQQQQLPPPPGPQTQLPPQVQQHQQQQSPQMQLQPQLQQHVVWDELRQRDAQILVLQKKLGHFRSWLAGVHAKVQATNPSAINNYKRLYVGNLPPNTTEEELRQFLHNLMVRTGANAAPGNAILSCKLKAAPAAGSPPGSAGPVPPPGPGPPDKHYAFIEFRSVEEASNAMAFDGVAFKNAYLKVRRPSNYDTATAVMLGPTTPDPTIDLSQLEICRTVVENSPHKMFVGGLPCEWSEDMVKELLVPYGTLKSFNLVMDKSTGKSKGYAFCEYVEDSSADLLIKNLHMRRIGSKALTVKRAMEGSRTGVGIGVGVGSPGGTGGGSPGAGPSAPGGGAGAGISMSAAQQQAQQQQQQLRTGSPQAIPPLTPANMAVMSRVAASPAGPGAGSPGGGPGGAVAAAAMAALSGVGPDSPSPGLRGGWGAQEVTEALNVLLQQHSASRNLFAAAAAAAATAAGNPAGPQTPSTVPGLAAALQQFHNRAGADLGSGGSGPGELAPGVGPRGHHHPGHHPQHPGHHPHHPQHPSQHQQQQEAAAAAAEAAQQLAAVGGFDLSSLTGSGIGFW